jgi:nucleotide-binding universal stress UspA family protein
MQYILVSMFDAAASARAGRGRSVLLCHTSGVYWSQSRVDAAIALGIKADSQQILGSPGKTICKVAKETEADLIVVGHRGRWGLTEILLGSVSNYVFHHANCCVLVVPTHE